MISISNCNKRYFTKEEMIYVLEKRGLIVDEPEILDRIGYAYLIYEFSDWFYCSKLKYRRGTKLSDLYQLYVFFKKLSVLTFEFIHDIELRFKKVIASLISTKGAYSYLAKESYRYDYGDPVFDTFYKKLIATHESFVQVESKLMKDKVENGVVPVWVFVNKLSLGDLIKFVKYNRKLINGNPYSRMNLTWKQMATISKFRNQIAHMNPIKKCINFSTRKTQGVALYNDFLMAIKITIPNSHVVLWKFFKKNKKLLHRSIRKAIKTTFFDLH